MIVAWYVAAAIATMDLGSPDFHAGGAIAGALMARDCGGANRTPALSWADAPKATSSFALIVRDPDAPLAGGFYHWVLYDIPAAAAGLRDDTLPAGTQVGRASTGETAYYGPCPPPGRAHHYVFTLYALDLARVPAASPLDGPTLERRIEGHVLARATLEATASHP